MFFCSTLKLSGGGKIFDRCTNLCEWHQIYLPVSILVLIKVFWFIQDLGILYFYGSTMAVMVVIEPQAVITMPTRAH